jgi:multiple sugar transport system ATP-binding protein
VQTSLTLHQVTKRFGGHTAVNKVSLTLQPGKFVALIGASGCGKSTTLRLLAGLETPDEGMICIDGRDVTTHSASERNIALMFQSYALYPHLTVFQNIAMPLLLQRLHPAQRVPGAGWLSAKTRATRQTIRTDVERIAQLLRLDELLARKPGQLSGGQQQRVALARALVREPTAFLLDEPLSNLDTQLRARTREEIKALHRRTGHAFLLVTHDQADALSMADEVAVMINGQIAQQARPAALYDAPQTPEVAAFIGAHGMNLFDPGPEAKALMPEGDRLIVGVRPEDLTLDPHGALEAHVTDIAFQGNDTLVSLRAANGQRLVAVTQANDALPAIGEAARLAARKGKIHLFDPKTRTRVTHPANTPSLSGPSSGMSVQAVAS